MSKLKQERLLTASELAKILNISEAHVRRLTSTHEVPHIKLGGAVRYRPSSIDEWLRHYTIRSRMEVDSLAATYTVTHRR